MPNENCLNGMQCPKCASKEPFYIEATTYALVYDSGSEEHRGLNWSEYSECCCKACDFNGKVRDFYPKYNHLFTVAFTVVTDKRCHSDPMHDPEDWPTKAELIAAMRKRIYDLEQAGLEVFEAIGPPQDTYEVNSLRSIGENE